MRYVLKGFFEGGECISIVKGILVICGQKVDCGSFKTWSQGSLTLLSLGSIAPFIVLGSVTV